LQRTQHRRLALAGLAVLVALAAWTSLPAAASAETGGAGLGEEGVLPTTPAPAKGKTPLDRQGMWIWYVSHSEHGNVAAIIARAKAAGIGTVYVKSGDGTGTWSQFNRSLVNALHKGGLKVCAWQFVYGDHPAAEAKIGAISVQRGADCLVIDAEGDYEGKYASADLYIRKLRAAIGETFPLSLAGFPYVDYHPSFPYSVFFGPGGATFNQPQMYWKTIGTSVKAVFEHTYLFNRLWGHPIYPLGQTYEGTSSAELKLFRRFSASFGLQPSWWDWQETTGTEWTALRARSAARPVAGYRLDLTQPTLKLGARGDLVVWAQEHLKGAGDELAINGIFSRAMRGMVRTFQEEHGLEVDGQIGTSTWQALLKITPYRMHWSAPAANGSAGTSSVGRVSGPSRPLSASLPAKAYEIPPGPRG
jgi:hypothetical protein